MSLPMKPKYGEACNGCGLCCAIELCHVGVLAFPGAKAPCPALKLEADGKRTYCEIVRTEQRFEMEPMIENALGIGQGCSMEDEQKYFCEVPEWA